MERENSDRVRNPGSDRDTLSDSDVRETIGSGGEPRGASEAGRPDVSDHHEPEAVNRGHIESTESPDNSIRTGDYSPLMMNRFTLPKATWEQSVIVVLFVLLILSLTVNGLAYARMGRNDAMLQQSTDRLAQSQRDAATELQLRRYNLDWFRAHEFAELEVKVGVLDKTCRR